MEKRNLIDEIVISNDDFQLPDFVSFIYASDEDKSWIETENGSPIKYSFAREYMSEGVNSIEKQLKSKYGKDELKLALEGKSDFVNFIFGTDEVPQLIYARVVSETNDLSANILPVIKGENEEVAKFDILGVRELLNNDLNFVTHSKNKTDKSMTLFLYNYNNHSQELLDETIFQMKEKVANGEKIGLIEIYSTPLLNTGDNVLFKTLLDGSTGVDITDLSIYSAWNTNANAIGLGVAHAQVFASAYQICENSEEFLRANTNMLVEHLLEDGIYTINTKRILSNEKYVPTNKDLTQSKKLLETLKPESVLNAFAGKTLEHNGNEFIISKCNLDKYNFPWGRIFECFLDINTVFEGDNE